MPKVFWTLTWFDRRTEEWVGEVRLRNVTRPQLRKLFGAPASDPMFDSYPVQKAHVPALLRWSGVPISMDKFDYFVECSSVPAQKPAIAAR